ncbi:MAG: permease-like cell division protein FtsX [Candidatus Zixiibacteriota bacterium]
MNAAKQLVWQIYKHAGREKRLSLGSFLVILIVLMMVDFFWIATININSHYDSLIRTVKMEVFVADDYPDSLLSMLEITFYELADIAATEYISREDAARILETDLGPEFMGGLDENPLPRSIIINFKEGKTLNELDEIAAAINRLESVQAVDFGRTWIEKVENFGRNLSRIGYFIGGLILIVVLLTMANTNRLTARTKSSEFLQLRLLGAGPSYLLYPFLAEGFFSALIAAIMGWLVIIYLSQQITFEEFDLIFPNFEQLAIYCLAAAVTGMIGAYLGIRRFLLL